MTKFENVPYRNWRRGQLGYTKVGQKIMKLAYDAMASGRNVEVTQSQPLNTRGPMAKWIASDSVYDTISVTIRD